MFRLQQSRYLTFSVLRGAKVPVAPIKKPGQADFYLCD